jgi:LysM repeat protein
MEMEDRMNKSTMSRTVRMVRSWAAWALSAAVLISFLSVSTVEGAPPSLGPVVHIVSWGENLTSIATRYGVGIHDIAAANRISDPNRIYVGQRLVIPLPPAAAAPPAGENVAQHVVQPGDTLSAIAVRYGCTINAIVQANRLVNPSFIYVGQTLVVPTASAGTPATPATGVYYTVRPGDTLATIAYRYEISYWAIVQANNLHSPSLIRAGQRLFIPGGAEPAVAAPTATPTPAQGTVVPTATPVPGQPTPTPDLKSCTPVPIAGPTVHPTCPVPGPTVIPLGPVPLPEPAPPKPFHMDTPEFGMIVHLWGVGDCVMDRDLRLVKDAGFTWVKQTFRWRDIEVHKDKFDWAEADHIVAMAAKYNLDLAIAVSHQPEWAGGNYPLNGPPRDVKDFADFVAALAERYEGLVRAYEIWPGPNVSENWGGMTPDPEYYAQMLLNAFWRVHEQDPFAMIISGGLVQTAKWDGTSTPAVEYFKALYATEAKKRCEAYGVQALGYLAAPENTREEYANPELNNNNPAPGDRNRVWGFRAVEELLDYMEPPDRTFKKQWVVTEMGWTTDARERSWTRWAAVPEEVKADYLWRAYRFAKDNWAPWVGVMFVHLTDARWTPDDDGYWWGVVDPNGCARKSYYSLKDMSK